MGNRNFGKVKTITIPIGIDWNKAPAYLNMYTVEQYEKTFNVKFDDLFEIVENYGLYEIIINRKNRGADIRLEVIPEASDPNFDIVLKQFKNISSGLITKYEPYNRTINGVNYYSCDFYTGDEITSDHEIMGITKGISLMYPVPVVGTLTKDKIIISHPSGR